MDKWSQVKWTEARQIAEAMEVEPAALPEDGIDPRSFYQSLKDKGELDRAVRYLGHALPRFEAVAWAAHCVRSVPRDQPHALDRQALDRTLQWLDEPTDDYRRAAQQAGQSASKGSPEGLLAMAAFMSGGSISPPDLPPVNPPQEVCGRIASAAVLIAAHRSKEPAAAIAAALEAGEAVAAKGAGALATK